ncbi:MAG: hypothetical protein ABUT20_54910 [Bacteroidota bacterium]
MKKPGYILILTLLLTSLTVVLVTSIVFKTTVLSSFARVFIDREKAKVFARNGIQIGLSQLNNLMPQDEKKDDSAKDSDKKKEDPRIEMFAKLFSIINRWQTFDIDQSIFQETGKIELYIASEEGKINLSKLYDAKKDAFVTGDLDGKKIATLIFDQLGSVQGSEKLLGSFEKFMKDRKLPLQDVSELLLMKELRSFKNQLLPAVEEKQADSKEKNKLYLLDLFTLETTTGLVDPMVLSESFGNLFGLDRQSTIDGQKWVKELPAGAFNSQETWDKFFSPLYKKEFKALPADFASWIATKSDPQIFSLLVVATVGKVKQKMYAIVHKDSKSKQFIVRKLYWL